MGSAVVDTAATDTNDVRAEDALLEQEVMEDGAETEALGSDETTGTLSGEKHENPGVLTAYL